MFSLINRKEPEPIRNFGPALVGNIISAPRLSTPAPQLWLPVCIFSVNIAARAGRVSEEGYCKDFQNG